VTWPGTIRGHRLALHAGRLAAAEALAAASASPTVRVKPKARTAVSSERVFIECLL
jgi:hypothetical protein